MRRRKAIRATVPVLLAACLLAGASVASAQSVFGLQDLPASSRLDTILLPPSSAGVEYRFAPDGPWLPFDSSLGLTAAPGEERSYTVETRSEAGTAPARRIVIDKRPPAAPVIEPGSGLYRDAVEVRLASRDGARLRQALLGPSLPSGYAGAPDAFSDYDPARPLRLVPPAAGAASYTLLAVAVDEAGNTSSVTRREFRLAAPGPDYAAPAPDPAPVALSADPLAGLGEPVVLALPGRVEISFAAPLEGELLAAVNLQPGRLDESAFAPMQVQGGRASLVLECPRGWKSVLPVNFALRTGEKLLYRELPYRAEIADRPVSRKPAAPTLYQAQDGGSTLVSFPAYDGRIFYQAAQASPVAYSGPFLLPPGDDPLTLRWYGLDGSGVPSEAQSKTFQRLPPYAPTVLSGIAEGGLTNEAVRLTPSGKATLRYEISTDATAPREPGPASTLVGEGLDLDAAAGQEVTYRLRYRGFSGDGDTTPVDEGGSLTFTIDRKPPEAPRAAGATPSYTSSPLRLELVSEGNEVFASVESGGMAAQASRLEGPLLLAGGGEGSVEYVVRAWALDKAGNRSPEMKPLRVVVDIATLYVQGEAASPGSPSALAAAPSQGDGEEEDATAPPRGDGSRDRPFATLDEALAFAAEADSGRSTICIRGRVGYSGGTKLSGRNLSIKGGFDGDWKPVQGARATLVVSKPVPASAPLIELTGARLSLSGLEVEMASGGTFVAAHAASALVVDNLGLSLGCQGDFLAFDLDASRLGLSGSSIEIREAQSAAVVQATRSEIVASDCRISAGAGVRYFSAFTLSGGGLSLGTSSISSSASLATRLLALESASITADRSAFEASGGPGFLSVASFTNANGVISDSHVRVSWKGAATLFRYSGGGPAFVHDSVVATTQKGRLRFFDSDGAAPSLRNSIFASVADAGDFLVTPAPLQGGVLVADCLSGFTTLVSQAGTVLDLGAVNALNAKVKGAKPCVSEALARTWPSSPLAKEGSFSLGPESACLDAAASLAGFPLDFSGKGRPLPGDKAKPDIGADER